MHHALTGATTQDGTDIPLMKGKLARATWSFKGHGALSDVDTKQKNSILNGTEDHSAAVLLLFPALSLITEGAWVEASCLSALVESIACRHS